MEKRGNHDDDEHQQGLRLQNLDIGARPALIPAILSWFHSRVDGGPGGVSGRLGLNGEQSSPHA